jgi:hypothetical protein
VNLTLAWKEWTWVEEKMSDREWRQNAHTFNDLRHVCRYMDDRFSTVEDAYFLPTQDQYGIRFSSREKGTSIDFVGWTIETAPDYADKQKKFPTLDLVRYPVACSAIPPATIICCVIGRLNEIWYNTTDDADKVTRFLQKYRSHIQADCPKRAQDRNSRKGHFGFLEVQDTKSSATTKQVSSRNCRGRLQHNKDGD